MNMEMNFFESSHGRNLCDAHTGTDKRLLGYEIQAHCYPKNTLVQAHQANIRNTTALLLPEDGDAFETLDVAPFKSDIRQFHCVTYPVEHCVKCNELTQDKEFVTQKIKVRFVEGSLARNDNFLRNLHAPLPPQWPHRN